MYSDPSPECQQTLVSKALTHLRGPNTAPGPLLVAEIQGWGWDSLKTSHRNLKEGWISSIICIMPSQFTAIETSSLRLLMIFFMNVKRCLHVTHFRHGLCWNMQVLFNVCWSYVPSWILVVYPFLSESYCNHVGGGIGYEEKLWNPEIRLQKSITSLGMVQNFTGFSIPLALKGFLWPQPPDPKIHLISRQKPVH